MIPPFQHDGNLPAGIHLATWREVEERFGTTVHRRRLLAGLRFVVGRLAAAGCRLVYLGGSFVTSKVVPSDFDGAWDMTGVDIQTLRALEPLLLDFSNRRAAQKAKYLGEMFPAAITEGASGKIFVEFLRQDKDSGMPRGIVAIDLRTL